jgi:uncharacterized protein with FMN-binding domain
MKKAFVTFSFIGIFAMYSLYQYFDVSRPGVYVASNTRTTNTQTPSPVIPTPIPTPPPVIAEKKTTTQPKPTTVPIPPPAPAPVVKKNLYADGTFTGSVADAYYGNIQVQTTIQNGKIVDVQFLQYPSDRSTSRRINSIADPQLASEAISLQSANVDIVSGATDSSLAFRQSLGSALTQARNS